MSNLSDIISNASLFGGFSYSFTYDRYCSPDSAIYFNNGYLQVPEGIYFPNDFTVTAWIMIKYFQTQTTIIDFNHDNDNRIRLGLACTQLNAYMSNSLISTSCFDGNSVDISTENLILKENIWYHIAYVSQNTNLLIYLNGIEVINSTNSPFLTYDSSTKLNFIGYSSNSILDELKIYNYALSSSDVLLDFNESSKNGKIKTYIN